MRATELKNGSIRFRGIANEAQYSGVVDTAEEAGCSITTADNLTVVTVSGTVDQVETFDNLYFA